MRTARIVQTVSLTMIVAMVVGCAASKEYTSKLFAPRVPVTKDSQSLALRFLDTDSSDQEQEGWVSTDIIMGRDTASKTYTLDQLAKVYPPSPVAADSSEKNGQAKARPVILPGSVVLPAESQPVARNANPGEVRTKRTRE